VTEGPGDPRFRPDGPGGDAAVPAPRDVPLGDRPADGGAVRPESPGTAVPRPRRPHAPGGRPAPPSDPPPRPRIVDDPGILGISRLTRGRVGSRLFTLFFVLVFTVIVVQMVAAILDNPW